MKSLSLNKMILATMALFATVAVFIFSVGFVYANPSQFVTTTQTTTATTSVIYMTAGTGTTTLVADTYQASTGNNYVNNTTELLLQFTASSTLSQLNVNLEYSNGYGLNGAGADCVASPSSCDWYQDTFTNVQNFATTTLPLFGTQQIPQYNLAFASSTVGQQTPTSTNNRTTRALSINAPVRYVRAVFTCNVGGAACGVWAQFAPSKETK